MQITQTVHQSHLVQVMPTVIHRVTVETEHPDPLRQFTSGAAISAAPWLREVSSDLGRGVDYPLPHSTLRSKRVLDVCGAATGIALLWPLMLVTAVAVKLSSPGEMIFCQQRVGLHRRKRNVPERRQVVTNESLPCGKRVAERRQELTYERPFTLYKFRTMVNDAEKDGAQFAVQDDPRVTGLGRFMRRTRLDELPQLWNVLRGDMSLVGFRPERSQFGRDLSEQVPNYLDRLQLKPGRTGIAQVVNGYDNNLDSFRRKVAYALLYLRNCCLTNDFRILLRTVWVVISGKRAI